MWVMELVNACFLKWQKHHIQNETISLVAKLIGYVQSPQFPPCRGLPQWG